MQTPTDDTVQPSDHNLLQLLEGTPTSSQYVICSDCLDVIENVTGSTHRHNCPESTFYRAALEGTISAMNPSDPATD